MLIGLIVAGQLVPGPGRVASSDRIVALDGDTLRLPDGRRVRLAGVDAPEVGRPGADAATDFAAAFVAAGPARLTPAHPPTDRYGRLLADVWVGSESLSARLVSAGLAWVYASMDATLIALQAEAVAARRGVHRHLDAVQGAPFVVGRSRIHRRCCPSGAGVGPLSDDLPGLLAAGLSPCRLCFAWPPRPGAW